MRPLKNTNCQFRGVFLSPPPPPIRLPPTCKRHKSCKRHWTHSGRETGAEIVLITDRDTRSCPPKEACKSPKYPETGPWAPPRGGSWASARQTGPNQPTLSSFKPSPHVRGISRTEGGQGAPKVAKSFIFYFLFLGEATRRNGEM